MTSRPIFSVTVTEEYVAFSLIEGIIRELNLSLRFEGHPDPLWIVASNDKPAFALKIDFKRKNGGSKIRVEGRKIEDDAYFESFMKLLHERKDLFRQGRAALEKDFYFTQEIGPVAFSHGIGNLPNEEVTINKCSLIPHKYPRKLETPQGIFGKQISFERVHSAMTIVKAIDGYEAPQIASRRFKEACAILSLITGCTLRQWGIPQIQFTEDQARERIQHEVNYQEALEAGLEGPWSITENQFQIKPEAYEEMSNSLSNDQRLRAQNALHLFHQGLLASGRAAV